MSIGQHERTMSRFLPVVLALAFAFTAHAEDLRVLAAASLTDALKAIAPAFEKKHGVRLLFSFAGSNVLARQIREGAPADVFVSADDAQMNALEKAGLVRAGTRREILSNTLAIVVRHDSPLRIAGPKELADPAVERLALADPQAVPAGIYAKEYLVKLGLWKSLEPRVIPTENVRAALAVVESGNVDAGIVYRTDATISRAVRIAYEVPPKEGPAISYPAAVLENAASPEKARAFVAHLQSEPARSVFRKLGFLVPE
jgi:molybdate transport system substrate-binding protein